MKTFTNENVKQFFGLPTTLPSLKGPQTTAIQSVSDNFIAVGNIVAEAKLSPEYAEMVAQRLYEAKVLLDSAIIHGWNGGKPGAY